MADRRERFETQLRSLQSDIAALSAKLAGVPPLPPTSASAAPAPPPSSSSSYAAGVGTVRKAHKEHSVAAVGQPPLPPTAGEVAGAQDERGSGMDGSMSMAMENGHPNGAVDLSTASAPAGSMQHYQHQPQQQQQLQQGQHLFADLETGTTQGQLMRTKRALRVATSENDGLKMRLREMQQENEALRASIARYKQVEEHCNTLNQENERLKIRVTSLDRLWRQQKEIIGMLQRGPGDDVSSASLPPPARVPALSDDGVSISSSELPVDTSARSAVVVSAGTSFASNTTNATGHVTRIANSALATPHVDALSNGNGAPTRAAAATAAASSGGGGGATSRRRSGSGSTTTTRRRSGGTARRGRGSSAQRRRHTTTAVPAASSMSLMAGPAPAPVPGSGTRLTHRGRMPVAPKLYSSTAASRASRFSGPGPAAYAATPATVAGAARIRRGHHSISTIHRPSQSASTRTTRLRARSARHRADAATDGIADGHATGVVYPPNAGPPPPGTARRRRAASVPRARPRSRSLSRGSGGRRR